MSSIILHCALVGAGLLAEAMQSVVQGPTLNCGGMEMSKQRDLILSCEV